MPVPPVDLAAQNAALQDELDAAWQRVLRSGRYVLGAEVEAFEAAAATFLEAPAALGVSSGTDALLIALMAADIGPGDEVLVPDFTFFATGGSVARVGATPVFVDVCPVCFNMDARDAATKVTPRTRALIAVHLYGQAARLDPLADLAVAHRLTLIEDCAQAFGARYKGERVGSRGDFGAFSFYPTKTLAGFGDAGLLTVRDEEMRARCQALRNHGQTGVYEHALIGGNFRLDALQAALLNVKLPHVAAWNSARQRRAERYEEKLGALPGVHRTSESECACRPLSGDDHDGDAPRLRLPCAYAHNEHVWGSYTIRVAHGRRDALRQHLADQAIIAPVYYPLPLSAQPCFRDVAASGANNVVSRQLAQEVLSLPLFPEMTDAQQDAVVSAIATWLDAS